ncbi:MAG: GNAT family N-acetyltransferase [Lachnospiraceae bacterium]|nr:GNAT family N-acetyltransferase [Lachnospiraceae bacterium]
MAKSVYLQKSDKITIQPTDEQHLWDSDWVIALRDDGTAIGTISFEGEKALGTVPLNIVLEERYRNRGFGTEAIRMMVDWAFLHKNVYEVTAVSEHENDKFVHALEKAGFVFRDGDRHIENYSIKKQKTAWTGLYLGIGIVLGLILGFVLNNFYAGMVVGVAVSTLIGAALDISAAKDREKVTGRKE